MRDPDAGLRPAHRPAWRPPVHERGRVDLLAVASVAVLLLLGALNLSALDGRSLVEHQVLAAAAGVVLFLAMRPLRTASLRWLGWACYGVSVLLLLAVAIAGASTNGARRWLPLGGLTVQPSELAKIGLLLVLADVLSRRSAWYRRLGYAVALAAVPIGLVVTEPDLSTATVLAAETVALLLLGRIPLRVLIPAGGALAAAVPFAEHLLRPYQLERLHAFLHGSTSASGSGWAILQAHIALAWGGLTGQAHAPGHLLLAQYLPERESDLAFASLVEQWGMRAGLLAVVAAAVLVWRLVVAARHARSADAALVSGGLAVLIGIEVAISVAANLGLLPTAGVPFPLLSYGGTAAAVHIAAIGLALRLRGEARRRPLWVLPRRRRTQPRLVRFSAGTLCLLLLGMIGFGVHLQRTRGDGLRAAGRTQMTRCVRIPAPRGQITDRHGVPVAVDVARQQVWAVPALTKHTTLTRLAALTRLPLGNLTSIVAQNAQDLTVVLGTVPDTIAHAVAAAHLTGVVLVPAPGRRYPFGRLLGPVLGWTGVATPADMARWPDLPDGAIVGRAGIEQQYDPLLRGTDGTQCLYVDPTGRPVSMASYTAPLPGRTLRLTLDLGLQKRLTAELAAALRHGGDSGAAVALDPRTGQVLAMASLPAYDDNAYEPPMKMNQSAVARELAAPGDPMLEHVTQSIAPPGSTFKLVVATADLRHRTVPPDRVVPTGGAWTLDGHTFHNWEPLPPQDLTQAIAWSNDVYFYKLAHQLGPNAIIDTARAFGVDRPTGIDLPGESAGLLGTPASEGAAWYPGSTVLLGIGQGAIAVTPLQDALWTAEVSTGSAVTPHLGLARVTTQGTVQPLSWPAARPLPFAELLGPVRAGMRAAVTSGTATALAALPERVGAKTGTAEDATAPDGATDAWMSAAAPLSSPRVEVTAFVHGGGEGGSSTARIALAALRYFFAHAALMDAGGLTAVR